MDQITTVKDAVEAFGGNRATAEIFGVGEPAVCNWKAAGRFPARLHYRVSREAEARSIKVAPALLGEDAA